MSESFNILKPSQAAQVQPEYSKQHLEEAKELAVFGDAETQIELQLGHVCNNRCVFCVSGQLTEERVAKQIKADPVFEAIRRGAEQGCKRVTFLGGEPTVQKSFLPALELAVELGYDEIVIFTNGVKTRKRAYVQKIIDLGGNYEWRFSVQGGTREAHDAVTKRRGSFTRIVQGMRHVADLGEDVTINMCINEYSYKSVPNFPALCQEYDVRQLHIDQIRPSDAGKRDDAYFEEIMPRYSEMAPYLREMLEGFDAIDPDFDVNLGNFPYCLLPEFAHKIHHDGQKTFTYPANSEGMLPAFDKYPTKRADKFHAPQCGKCAFQAHCNGIFETYDRLYGNDEFRPVTLEHLREMDGGAHFFVQIVTPRLELFFQSEAPAPWKAVERFSNTRDRVIEVRYVDAGGHRATLVFTPPPGVGKDIVVHQPIFATSEYRLSLLCDAGIDVRDVIQLLRWAEERLSAEPAIEVEQTIDYARLVAGFFEPRRLQKGQRRLRRLADAVARQSTFANWRFDGIRPLDNGLGTVLGVVGPSDERVDLVLELQPDDDKPLVGVSYRLGEGVGAEMARPVLSELMQALRG